MISVAVVDYGMGNLRSVAKALEHVAPQARVTVTDSAGEIAAADRVVVPGQGGCPRPARVCGQGGSNQAISGDLHRSANVIW